MCGARCPFPFHHVKSPATFSLLLSHPLRNSASSVYNRDMKSQLSKHTGPPTVTFLGAAQAVSGSMHLVEVGPYRLLLDCGLTRGPRDESRLRNRYFSFD